MTTYIAWDGNEYPHPVPTDWYKAADDRWWPPGHGPGPAAEDRGDDSRDSVRPNPQSDTTEAVEATDRVPQTDRSPQTDRVDSTDDSTEDSTETNARAEPRRQRSGGGAARARLGAVLFGLFLLFASVAYLVFGSGTDDSSPATTTPQSRATDGEFAETTVAAGQETGPTTSAAPGKGSPNDPYVVDDKITLRYGDGSGEGERVWEVQVTGSPIDRTSEVLEENQFNEPPLGDARFVLVPIRVTYVSGPAPASLFDLNFKAVGPSAVVLTTFDPSCGVVPNALDTLAELFPGGTIEGNICWVVGPDDIDSLTMLIEIFLVEGDIYVDLASG